ncbi:hypothetical protein ACI65C_013417 [Semiaphis heraclei]
MEKRKFQSGASKRSAKRRNDLIACGLSPSQQKLNFVFQNQINTDVQADGPYINEEDKSENQINADVQADGTYIDEENKSVPNTALSPEAIEEITLFLPPNINASASDKLCFLRYHPIQPSGDLHNLPFKTCRLYYRIMSNQTMVQRKWLSYSLHLNKIYCVTCLCYTDRTSPFTQGITPSTKHVYNQVELHEKSSTHGMALMSFLSKVKNQCTKSLLTKKHSEDRARTWRLSRYSNLIYRMLSRPAGGDTPYHSWCVLAGLPRKRAGLVKVESRGELHFLKDPRLATLPWRTGYTNMDFA